MTDIPFPENDFLKQLTAVVEENLSDEQFGVSELARTIGMSRSNLLRKVKKQTGLSVSRFIRHLRLERAMELLKQPSLTVSEVAFQVGFNSTSYFIKCFREHYGYPPGEAEKRDFDESEAPPAARAHQLAAIMFTDIQGYTALMQQDEEKALQIRNRHRQVFEAATAKFRGKILQYYGDGTLSIFRSAIDAVKCGIELQLAFRSEPQIPVRIGIHSGDIIINEEDIIGDGVNVASRIESLASAGSVFISGKVYDEVKNQAAIQTTSLGLFEFKNVEKPLEVFAVANPGLAVPEKGQLTGKLKSQSDRKKIQKENRRRWRTVLWLLAPILLAAGAYLFFQTDLLDQSAAPTVVVDPAVSEKSIAVLPFINDSNDSTNVYIINGLMEAILNHLQKMGDLRVISRTSVEKYRHTTKTIPEIGQELGVQYFVEGSGQKIGDQILLTIQLVEAPGDRHLWSEQYRRETTDIFSLQREVARKIADEIEVVLTPEEKERLEEVPTQNLAAYDAYLKGGEFFFQGNREGLERAIPFFEKAVELDSEFGLAYAGLAIAYYYLDYNQADKQYAGHINNYADKALLYDGQSAQSLVAKALYYIYNEDYVSALPHLEKALEYNPNSALVIRILSEYYTQYVPDTEKYLEYALQGIRLDIASHDSTTASYIYLHLSSALVQSGFVEEAEYYINQSLSYDPENLFSAYVKAFILYAENRDLAETKSLLLESLERDPTRLDVMQEVAKIAYFMRDYEESYRYYQPFAETRERLNLGIYPEENAKIAMVMRQTGRPAEAEKYMQLFKSFAESDRSIYGALNRAIVASYYGDAGQVFAQMQQFAEEDNYHYWILLFLELDPLMDEVKSRPAFQEVMRTIERKFWERHERIKARLEEQHLM